MKPIFVHVHVFYPHLWEELKACIQNIRPYPFELYVTMVNELPGVLEDVRKTFPDATVEIVENRGYDIGPFIHVINKVILDNYSYVVKLHTKRNVEYCFRKLYGPKFRESLLSFICTHENFLKSLKVLLRDKNVGMVNDVSVIVNNLVIYDKKSRDGTKQWLKEHNFRVKNSSFVGGSMFIARASIFKNIQELGVSIRDFPEPDEFHQSQLAHIFERLLGYFVAKDGYIISDFQLSRFQQFKRQVTYALQAIIIRKNSLFNFVKKKWNVLEFISSFVRIKRKNGRRKIYFCGIQIVSMKMNPNNLSSKDCSCDLENYADWLDELHNNRDEFVPFSDSPYQRKKDDVKVFAFYLPQFHSIPENDLAHGKGFTEWTNVASCRPYFIGHYQPKIPYDLGFYNLLQPGIMERQVEIAKTYGIYGFCFYYYWFSGKRVLEKPLEYFLKSGIDFRFHFCWADENWSKLWDGGNKQVFLEQKLEEKDAEKFFNDILPYVKDDRYEKVNNKPIMMVYKADLFDKQIFNVFVKKVDRLAREEGFDGFYWMGTNANGFNDPKLYGMNGIIEFPPHGINTGEIFLKKISKTASLRVYGMESFFRSKEYLRKTEYTTFKTCFPGWDNSPRKAFSGGSCFRMDLSDFEEWLTNIIHYTKTNNKKDEQYVYINAWNEWAEGAILEPTTRYGYRTLDAVKRVLEQQHKKD